MKFLDAYRTPGAIDFLYDLIAERMTEPEVNISATMPTPEQHRQFFSRHPYRYWYLIAIAKPEDAEDPPPISWAGYISATSNNEIGIVLRKAVRRHGLGSAAVRELMRRHEPLPAEPSVRRGKWVANVNPQNTASIAMFTALGARHIQNTYEL